MQLENQPATLLSIPVDQREESYSYSYSEPGLLAVSATVEGGRGQLPKRRLSVYDVGADSPKPLMELNADCGPFSNSVAAEGLHGLIAFECVRQSTTSLQQFPEVRLFHRSGDAVTPLATLPISLGGKPAFAADGRLLIDAQGGPILTAWRIGPQGVQVPTEEPLFRVALATDGAWTAVAADGRFDTNELQSNRLMSWVLPDAASEPIAIEAFLRDYYEPQLIQKLIAGVDLPKARAMFGRNRSLPSVSVTGIEQDPSDPSRVRITIRAQAGRPRRQGGGAGTDIGIPAELKVFVNGTLMASRRAGSDYELSDGAAAVTVTAPVPRRDGSVTVTAYAYNQDSIKGESDTRTYLPAPGREIRKGRAVVVTVGVDATSGEGWDLAYAVNDAVQFAAVVGDSLTATNQYSSVDRLVLRATRKADGTVESTATKAGIAQALEEFAAGSDAALGPDDVLIVALSAHGISSTTGEFYLLPSDIGPSKAPTFAPERTISSDELSAWLSPIEAGTIALIIDACQSGAVIQREGFQPGPMGNHDFGQLAYDKGMLILAASQSLESAREIDSLQRGLLSYALTGDGLRQSDADWQPRDGVIDLREWLSYGVQHVPALASRLGVSETQQPIMFDFVRRSVRLMPAIAVRSTR